MRIVEKLLEVFRDFEKKIHETEFEQFTIDFVQNSEMDLNEDADENLSYSYENDLLGSYKYKVSCILNVIKPGKDRDLFIDLNEKLQNIQ